MKKTSTLLFFALMCMASTLDAQRYLEEIFDEVTVTSGEVYGVNATVLYYNIEGIGEALPEALLMDVYEPTGDTETMRPLILYFHTGNFLPHPQNQSPSGLRTDSATVELCTRFARMGYVVASCDYRLGWNPIAETQGERVYTLINAAYRGVQDCRTAVRYFRMSEAEMDNPYGIDPNRIAVWGQGTGGYIGFAASTINNYITDIASIPKFVWDPDGDGTPQPMVIDFVNGDIYGTTYGVNPFDGDTLCYANHVGYCSDFHAMVNMGGAMGDISWLENNSVPMISLQVPTDPFAPYQDGTVIVPVLNLPVVEVSGSYSVQEKAASFGNNAVFAEVSGDPYSNAADNFNDGYNGLFPLVRPAEEMYMADSAPWEWWADTNPNNANGLATNPDMSDVKAKTYIDSIQWYTAPRLACALNLPGAPCASPPVNDLLANASDVSTLLGGPIDVQQNSFEFTNENATGEDSSVDGIECWADTDDAVELDESIDNSVWFSIEGDGLDYIIETTDCGGTATFYEDDTQIAVYTGDCLGLTMVACNDDIDFDGGNYWSSVTLETIEGTTYYILVDGFNYVDVNEDPAAEGTFCLGVTQYFVSVPEVSVPQVSVFPNPANDLITVQASSRVQRIEVYNVLGERVLLQTGLTGTRHNLDVRAMQAGVYSVIATFENSSVTTSVVVE